MFAGIWGCLLPIDKIFTSQMACTEGLPAPLGIHEARRLPKSLAWLDRTSAGYLQAGPAAYER